MFALGSKTNPVWIISGFDEPINCSTCGIIMLHKNKTLKLPGYDIQDYSDFVWKGNYLTTQLSGGTVIQYKAYYYWREILSSKTLLT